MGIPDIADSRPYASELRGRRRRAWSLRWLGLSTGETTRVLPVVIPVGLAGAFVTVGAVVAIVADPPNGSAFIGIGALVVAAAAAEVFPLPIEGVNTSWPTMAIVFLVSTAAIYGWAPAAIAALLATPPFVVARSRAPSRAVFNAGVYVCAAAAAGIAGTIGRDGDTAGAIVGSVFSAAAAFYVVNMVLLAAVVGRSRQMPFVVSFRRYVATSVVPFLVFASFAVTLVLLWDRSPFLSFLVIGPFVTIAIYERWVHGAMERLREFDRLKDEFIAVISHELRTPLTSVYGAALTLQKHDVRDEMRESLLAVVADEAGRLARLLDDALSASRLHAQSEKFAIQPTDAAELAGAVVDATRSRLPEGFSLEFTAGPDVPPVAADPDKLRQVLVNLLENAIKYSPDGGRIQVTVEPIAGSHVRFSVSDEGIGIPAQAQDRIFERFHRLDPHMSRGVGGTGLGLYICRELVEHMGGSIWVTSKEGRGSTFGFQLPTAPLA